MMLFPVTPRKIEKWASQKKYDRIVKVLSMDERTDLQEEAIKTLTRADRLNINIGPKAIELYNKKELRRSLIALYGKERERDMISMLAGLLETEDEHRSDVIRNLGLAGNHDVIPALLSRMTLPKERELIVEALTSIVKRTGEYGEVLKEFTADKPDDMLLDLCTILSGLKKPTIAEKLREYVFTPNNELRKAIAQILGTEKSFNWSDCLRGDENDFKRLAEQGDESVFRLLMEQYEQGNRLLDHYPDALLSYYLTGKGKGKQDEFISFVKKNSFDKAVPALKKYLWSVNKQERLNNASLLSSLGVKDYDSVIKGVPDDFIRLLKKDPEEGAAVIGGLLRTNTGYGPERETMLRLIVLLGKSGIPGAEAILFAGFSEGYFKDECFDALPPTEDKKITAAIMKMLVSYDGKERIRAAEKLDQMGDHRWKNLVSGDSDDIERLCMAGNPNALDRVIMGMEWHNKEYREEAAKLLLNVFRQHPEYPLNWKDVISKMRKPHEDSHADDHSDTDRSSDCHTDVGESVHTDTGLTMSFYEEDLKNFSRVDYLDRQTNSIITEEYLIKQINENEAMLTEEMFDDVMRFSSGEMIASVGRLAAKKHPLAHKAVEYLLTHRAKAMPYLAASLLHSRDERVLDVMAADAAAAFDLLVPLLKGEGPHTNVIEVLGMTGDTRAIDILKPFLVSPNDIIRRRTAEALAKLGEPEWLDVIVPDQYDFIRVGRKADPQLLGWYRSAFTDSGYGYMRVILAKALAIHGERELASSVAVLLTDHAYSRSEIAEVLSLTDDTADWKEVIRGDEGDINRVAAVGNKEAVRILKVFLSAPGKEMRTQAAEALLSLAGKDFSVIQDQWPGISKTITQKHEDSTRHIDHYASTRSGDCHSDSNEHTDSGLGLIIPENLA